MLLAEHALINFCSANFLKDRDLFFTQWHNAFIYVLVLAILYVIQVVAWWAKSGKDVDFLLSKINLCCKVGIQMEGFLVPHALHDCRPPFQFVILPYLLLDPLQVP